MSISSTSLPALLLWITKIRQIYITPFSHGWYRFTAVLSQAIGESVLYFPSWLGGLSFGTNRFPPDGMGLGGAHLVIAAIHKIHHEPQFLFPMGAHNSSWESTWKICTQAMSLKDQSINGHAVVHHQESASPLRRGNAWPQICALLQYPWH